MGKIIVGTSGYSYKEWVGPFYPENTKQADYLAFYAGRFETVELNFSYYAMPASEQLRRMLETDNSQQAVSQQAARNLTYSIKAHQSLTHKIDPAKWRDEAKTYLTAIEPLLEAGRLDAVLIQFPFSFRYEADNRRHLANLLTEFSGAPVAVEFRNNEWNSNRVIDEFKKRNVAYVSTDSPDIKGLPNVLDVSTSSISYFRLHGRNEKNWWDSDSRSRYDYLYNDEELKGAAERVRRMAVKADKALVYFNNHARGQAVKNAQSLKKILENENGTKSCSS
ncbi:MAG: DUF72 domain-containing protein [Treponema sp.]|nr:DUF72 domain-containing protein [Treponema sp.]